MDKIEFSCDGKCRLCPYPGANCKRIPVKSRIPVRELDEAPNWMSLEFQEELRRLKHIG